MSFKELLYLFTFPLQVGVVSVPVPRTVIVGILKDLKGEIERSQQHQCKEIILSVLWRFYGMETVTLPNFRLSSTQKTKSSFKWLFSFLLHRLLMHLLLNIFGEIKEFP